MLPGHVIRGRAYGSRDKGGHVMSRDQGCVSRSRDQGDHGSGTDTGYSAGSASYVLIVTIRRKI